MSLSLSSRDLSRYRESVRILLSPLDHTDPEEWLVSAIRSVSLLLSGNSGAAILPNDDSAHLVTDGMDHEAFVRFQAHVLSTEPEPGYTEQFARAMEPVQKSGVEVCTSEDLARLTGIALVEMPQYQEALKPSGIEYTINLSVPQERGEALLGVGRGHSRRGPFGERDRALLQLLLPAFQAGVHVWRQLSAMRCAIDAMVNRLHDGAVVLDGRGRALHANAALGDLSRRDPEFPRLTSAMSEMARALRRPTNPRTEPSAALVGFGAKSVETNHERYLLIPTVLPEGMVIAEPVVLMIVRPTSTMLPTEVELRDRFWLTRREAEVALLLARGLSNRRIAELLFLSPHTVRHHAQRVLEKVGVSSRRLLVLHFLSRSEDRPGSGRGRGSGPARRGVSSSR